MLLINKGLKHTMEAFAPPADQGAVAAAQAKYEEDSMVALSKTCFTITDTQ